MTPANGKRPNPVLGLHINIPGNYPPPKMKFNGYSSWSTTATNILKPCLYQQSAQTLGNVLMTQINATCYVKGEFPKLCKTLEIIAAPVKPFQLATRIPEAKVKVQKRLLRVLVK